MGATLLLTGMGPKGYLHMWPQLVGVMSGGAVLAVSADCDHLFEMR